MTTDPKIYKIPALPFDAKVLCAYRYNAGVIVVGQTSTGTVYSCYWDGNSTNYDELKAYSAVKY